MSVDTDKARERAAYLRNCASPGDSEEAAALIESLASELDRERGRADAWKAWEHAIRGHCYQAIVDATKRLEQVDPVGMKEFA